MNREGLQISAVEHYRMLVDLIRTLPACESLEAGLTWLRPEPGHQLRFCVHRSSAFDIYRAWWNGNQLTSQRDFTILFVDLTIWRERALMELGAQQLQLLNLDHIDTICNGNINTVKLAPKSTIQTSSIITDPKDGSSFQSSQ